MTMFFQFTFFVAILVLSGRLEEAGMHSVFFIFKSVVQEKAGMTVLIAHVSFYSL